jgi:hypothetical protein
LLGPTFWLKRAQTFARRSLSRWLGTSFVCGDVMHEG